VPALEAVFPVAEHRFCARHILQNMKQRWNSKAFRDLFWGCSYASTVQEFSNKMEDLRAFNGAAFNWLAEIPPHHWSRSHFTGLILIS